MKKVILLSFSILIAMAAIADAIPILAPYVDDVRIVGIDPNLTPVTAKVKVVNQTGAIFSTSLFPTLFKKGASPELDQALTSLSQNISVPANSSQEYVFIFPVPGWGG